MIAKTLIKTENLTFGYKKALCLPANLHAKAGDLICVIGRNGVGKSSLLSCLCGILPTMSGDIYIADNNLKQIHLSKRSELISFVPSKTEFTANLTVNELAEMGRSPYTNLFNTKSSKDILIVETALEFFNLTNLKHRALWSLSDGEKQKAMICRAFIQQTPIIILDEPTAFLDYNIRQKLLTDLKKLTVENQKCIIFSSHDIDIALKFANKVWFFNDLCIEEYMTEDFIKVGYTRLFTDESK